MPSSQPGNRIEPRQRTTGEDRAWLQPRRDPVDRATIDAWRADVDRGHGVVNVKAAAALSPRRLEHGISVIVLSHGGRDHLERCLGALAAQTLDPALFEVIVVLPSPPDGTRDVLDQFRQQHDDVVSLRIIELKVGGSSRARNAGVAAAGRRLTTFVEAADYVSAEFLQALLAYAEPGVMPVAPVVEFGSDGEKLDTDVNAVFTARAGQLTSPLDLRMAMTFNGSKVVETALIKDILLDTSLNVRDDLVFWAAVVTRGDLMCLPCPASARATYCRIVPEKEAPIDATNFDVAVRERLDLIAGLERIAVDADGAVQRVINELVADQSADINNYLRSHGGDHGRVVALLDRCPIFRLPYERMNATLGRTLAIAYAFPPFADTSAVVAAKRIRARGDVVDVVYNKMDTIRERDETLRRIAGPFVEQEAAIRTPSYFLHWGSMEAFAVEGLKTIERWEATKGPYDRMYSRAQFAASHLLAAAYKVVHPGVVWTAEFSDPLSRDVLNKERGTPVTKGALLSDLRAGMRRLGLPVPNSANSMVWCEEITYVLADSLVFTNKNQLEYMLGYCTNPKVAATARGKAVISPHPKLSSEFYSMADYDYPLEMTIAHVAYFGNFYATRGLDDVLAALARLDPDDRARVRLHVFTAEPGDLRGRAAELGVSDTVHTAPYVPYLEFLSLCRKFDCLIVNDAVTDKTHVRNPYLPSKWADYAGSGTVVWGLVEEGSALSRQTLDHVSRIGDAGAAADILTSIVKAKIQR